MSDLIRSSECPEYYFEERCYIRELLNGESEPGVSIAQARVEAGVTTVLHSVKSTEVYYIISGTGRAEVGGHFYDVNPGDLIHITAEKPQRITNTGTNDLIFLAICAPRFTPENYTDLEENL